MSKYNVDGKLVVIAGGSKGLGKALGLELAAKGASLLLLARTQRDLDIAREDICQVRKSTKQVVDTVSMDLTSPQGVDAALKNYGAVPDVLICTAGGSPTQGGFLADISPDAIKSCLELNYYTAIFIAQSCLKIWLAAPPSPSTRHIVFTSSTAAFVSLPGYIAYTPTKTAIRAVADTLRQELLLYGDKDTYQVHCFFPGTFLTDSFMQEQSHKAELTKIMEKSNAPIEELRTRTETVTSVAKKCIKGLEAEEFFTTVDFEGQLLLNNMRGPSPRDHGIVDVVIGWVATVAWWFVRRDFDRQTLRYGRTHLKSV